VKVHAGGIARVIAIALLCPAASGAQTPDLQGLWSAVLRFGPDIRGTLIVHRSADGWQGDIAGFYVPARFEGDAVAFELPDSNGSFRGKQSGRRILGQWIQPRTEQSGLGYATPVTLEPDGPSRWRGTLTPLQSRFTFYLPVRRRSDGTLQTYLRNPERNLGWFVRVSRLDVAGSDVRLIGRTRPGSQDTTLVEARYADGVISVPLRGGVYDFTRVQDESASAFYPRQRGDRYRYTAPLRLDDGWPVAPVEDVGISRPAIERFVQMLIDLPMDSLGTSQLHSLLIARHGKLVVEEYFHGYHRDQPHDTRSASKSWVAALIGAAMQAGVPIRLDTPVYQTMLGSVPADLDPRKGAMTLEHLISMTAGYACDPSGEAPGTADEDVMQSQEQESNWYRYTLNVPLESAPGEKLFYCSAEPNLAGGMLEKIAGEPLPELFDRLIARPLRMRTYHLLLQPTGEAYGGGGHHFVPRDFMKLAQLMVNDGKWGGRQILSPDWARKSTAPHRELSALRQQYGWLWNSVEYAYKGRKVRAFFAGGNGGQIFMGIPELDLVIAFTGGSYNQASLFIPQRVYVPQHILPAVN
jgi:CubicO group peptidase (beta-lactamase class C family)